MDNFVSVTGNITRDPELRYTQSGREVANFGIAHNRRWQNRQTQEWEEEVSFFDVAVWGDMAKNVAESIYRGDRVTVSGRLKQSNWETDAGEKRSKVEIVADEVAPSLRWATIPQVVKNEKASGGRPESAGGRPAQAQGGRGEGGGRPAAAAAPAGGSRLDSYDGEEPF